MKIQHLQRLFSFFMLKKCETSGKGLRRISEACCVVVLGICTGLLKKSPTSMWKAEVKCIYMTKFYYVEERQNEFQWYCLKKLQGFKVSFAACSTTLIAKHVTKYYFGKTENTNEAKVNQERILLSLYYFDYLTLYLNRQIIWHTVLGMRKTHLLPHERNWLFLQPCEHFPLIPKFCYKLSQWNMESYLILWWCRSEAKT